MMMMMGMTSKSLDCYLFVDMFTFQSKNSYFIFCLTGLYKLCLYQFVLDNGF